MTCFEVHVTGRLPQGVTEAINTRLGKISTCQMPNSTVLNGSVADQAALRALLDLIWDTGGSVLLVDRFDRAGRGLHHSGYAGGGEGHARLDPSACGGG